MKNTHDEHIQSMVPMQWSSEQEIRLQEIQQTKEDLLQYQKNNPDAQQKVQLKLHELSTMGPYYELIEQRGQHPLESLLEYLSQLDENLTGKVVRRLHLSSNSDEFTYSDPYEEIKRQFNLVQMNNISFKKLQKLLSDLYRFGQQKILKLWIIELPYTDYVKVQLSCLKKALLEKHIDQEGVECISSMCAQNNTYFNQVFNYKIQESKKIQKLFQMFQNLEQFIGIDQDIILNMQATDSGPINQNIFTRQQLYQSLCLFAIIQCECTIANALGLSVPIEKCNFNNTPLHLCTYDFSWNENCWGKLRDYLPKLANKLNKRYNLIQNLPIYDKQFRIAVIYYTQSLLGYYHHNYCYSSINLPLELKAQIQKILRQEQTNVELPIIFLVANARMYVQLLYAFK